MECSLQISQEEWRLRKNLWENIETPETVWIDQTAKTYGASFSRVCGAGGGGVMAVFFCEPDIRVSLRL